MFLHLGDDLVVFKKDVIAILDIRAQVSPVTAEFIEIARDEGFLQVIAEKGKEKSFVITSREVYISPISCNTLKKRAAVLSDDN
ncbi:extracellular matrix regulator RemB [Desulfotomaculum copahuensis]|uniref:DUF370 domain-containing protein n=1 Tax=Desulfotomaculum copahuensis TaxID=1838280 RepID=A0A1B7LBK2_9FIRM|nr:extracellular matrix/biofilm biosynthesis regulator RemA family protein [Desulfotomaculum copahuensis]OAT79891.1 DUF370 domain-containing protein [Desulfotomaculum copahuensis]